MGSRSAAGRRAGLDGLRGLAALGVLVLHVWMYTGAHQPGRSDLVDAVVGELRLGVVLFFVLSAFLLSRPWARRALDPAVAVPHPLRFLRSRARRLYPAYVAALGGALLVLHDSGHPHDIALSTLPAFLVFAQNHVDAAFGRLDPPTWSLAVEVAFCVALPLIGSAYGSGTGRRRPLAVAAAAVLAGLVWGLAAQLGDWPPTVTTSLPTFLPVFACGLGAAALAEGRQPSRAASGLLLVAGAALVVLDGIWHSQGTGLAGHVVRDLPAAAGFAAIVVAGAAHGGRTLGCLPLRALGRISYGLYLWHLPVLLAYRLDDALPEHPVAAAAAVLAPTVALASASYVLLERPVRGRVVRPRGRLATSPASAR